jgi:hypothetical protein
VKGEANMIKVLHIYMYETRIISPGMVTHACNPSYLGDGDQEDHGLRPAQAKSSQDPHLNKWPGKVTHACHPSYMQEAQMGRSTSSPALGIKQNLSQ